MSCVLELLILSIVQAGTTAVVLLCCVWVGKVRIVSVVPGTTINFVVPKTGLLCFAAAQRPIVPRFFDL